MPYTELLSRAIFTGAWSRNAAASSSEVIWKEPSPSISHTGFLSSNSRADPTRAPMAAGRPKPIVPRPPEDSQEWGLLNSMIWVAHI